MKRRPAMLVALMLALAVVLAPFAYAATSTATAATPAAAPGDKSPVAPIAVAISTVTGIAISPLLGTGVYGAWQYYNADTAARPALPWFAQVKFWLPALLIVALCAAKDAFGTVVPPGLKKPLDVLETIENKASGLVAAGAVVPFTMAALSKMVIGSGKPAAAAAFAPDGLAMIPLGAIDLSWGLNLLTVPFGIAMFVVVWMAAHAINVLILLSPWGAIDAALKSARTGLLGLLTLTSAINPWVGAVLSLIVVLVAWRISGWAFRLTHFGTVFCWDFFTLRRARFEPKEDNNALFAGGNLPGVPPRTYGRLTKRTDGGLEFAYRPWLFLTAKMAVVTAEKETLAVGRGLFFSSVVAGERDTLFLLPPRYHGHEEAVANAYQMGGGVRDAGLRKAWSVLKELFGGVAAKTQVI
ncbi:MAG TPA: hypothetical protein VHO24_05570 [Opitutaceae bacterium]|nr:hypothetical protein [Opitutaceae bacterium]